MDPTPSPAQRRQQGRRPVPKKKTKVAPPARATAPVVMTPAGSRLPAEVVERIVGIVLTSESTAPPYDLNARHLRSQKGHATALSCALVNKTWRRASQRVLFQFFAAFSRGRDSGAVRKVISLLARGPRHCRAYVRSICVDLGCRLDSDMELAFGTAIEILVDCVPQLQSLTLFGPQPGQGAVSTSFLESLTHLRSIALTGFDTYVYQPLRSPNLRASLREVHIRTSAHLSSSLLVDVCTLPHLDTVTFVCESLQGPWHAGTRWAPLRHLHVSFGGETAHTAMISIICKLAPSLQTLIVQDKHPSSLPEQLGVFGRSPTQDGSFPHLRELVWSAADGQDNGELLEVLDQYLYVPKLRHLGIPDDLNEYLAITLSRVVPQLDTLTLIPKGRSLANVHPGTCARAQTALEVQLDRLGVALRFISHGESGVSLPGPRILEAYI